MSFLNLLFDKRQPPISESSRKLYISNLKKLNGGVEPIDFKFLKSIKKVFKVIEKLKPTTQRTYFIAICSLLANGNGPKKLYDEYYAVLTQMNKDLSTNTTKSERQKENWLSNDEIKNIDVNLSSKVKKVKLSSVTKDDYKNILEYVVFSLFTKIQPRRNIDYTLMKISSDDADIRFNYLDVKNRKFIFNAYKTQKKYHQVIVDIPDELWIIIKDYLRFHPSKSQIKNKKHSLFFLVTHDNKNLANSNDITKILNSAFGANVGASLLRNIYLSNKYGDVINDLKTDTAAMATSVDMALNNYIKKT